MGRSALHQRESLRIRDQLGGIQRVAYRFRLDGFLVVRFAAGHRVEVGTRVRIEPARRDPRFFHRRDQPRVDRFGNQRERVVFVDSRDDAPLAGAFLSRHVEYAVDQIASFRVFKMNDPGGDFDQKAVQFASVPFGEYAVHRFGIELQAVFQQCVSLRD